MNNRRRATARGAALAAALVAACVITAAPGNARETGSARCPVVIDSVLAAADRTLWDTADGRGLGRWFSVEDYHALGTRGCDGLILRADYDRKRGTWEPGLEMAVEKDEDGRLALRIRAHIDNPKGNHDKRVEVTFAVTNGQDIVARASESMGIEEGDEKDITVRLSIPESALRTDPMTGLRVTIAARDD